MKKLTLLFLLPFIFSASILYAQDAFEEKLLLYFDSDKYEVKKEAAEKLDQFLAIHKEHISQIVLTGHTDSKGSEVYNHTLSQKRAHAVKDYLLKKGIKNESIQLGFQGEIVPISDNNTNDGRQLNRRVSAVFYIIMPKKTIEIKPNSPIVDVNEDSTTIEIDTSTKVIKELGDTSIEMGGMTIVMSKEDLKKHRDCLIVNPYTNGDSAFDNDLETIDEHGNPLVSYGMMSIRLKEDCECDLTHTLRIRFPTQANDCRFNFGDAKLYILGANNRWGLTNQKVTIVSENNISYYEFKLNCANINYRGTTYNLDVETPCVPKRVRFKVPKAYTIDSLNIVYDCPIANYSFDTKRNKAIQKMPSNLSDKNAFVYLKLSKNDEVIELSRIPLRTFKKSLFKVSKKGKYRGFGSCKKRFWPHFRFWNYKFHARYRLNEKQIKAFQKKYG